MFFDSTRLAGLMHEELRTRGVEEESRRHVVASLIQTSLRGVDSHGINLFPHYCRAAVAGRVTGAPKIKTKRVSPSVTLVDADHAFGHHAGAVGMEAAIANAKETGMGAASVAHSTHFGAASYFGLMAPSRGCLGFSFTNADALVKAFNAREAFFGTNPICFTAPLAGEEPLCLDMATSSISWNKVKIHRMRKARLAEGLAYDANGDLVTDPDTARSLAPAGGYKGFDLGMMVGILCAVLSGSPLDKDIMPMFQEPLDSRKRNLSHFFMALDLERFGSLAAITERLTDLARRIRSLAPRDPSSPVLMPGDPEKAAFATRTKAGIPIDDVKYEEFLTVSPVFAEARIK